MSGVDELLLATDEGPRGRGDRLASGAGAATKVRTGAWCSTVTKDAIRPPPRRPAELNTDLVDAQETRRIVDRLFGYEISPVLWRRVALNCPPAGCSRSPCG